MDLKSKEQNQNLLVITNNPDFVKQVTELLQACGLTTKFSIVQSSYNATSQHSSIPLVLIDISDSDPVKIQFTRTYIVSNPHSKVICAGANLNVDLILSLLKLGIHHFLKIPIDLQEAKTLFLSLLHGGGGPISVARRGKVVTIYSPKGGSGVTLLSINLAIALSKIKKERVAICDLAPQAGDVTTYLNVNPKYTLRELMDTATGLDSSLLEGVMSSYENDISILSSPALDQEPLSTHCVAEFQTVLQLLKQNFDWVVIDSARTDEALLQHALSHSDIILLVGNLDVPSLKGILLGARKLAGLHIEPDKIKIVINRFNAKNQLNFKEFSANVKYPIMAKLPNDYAVCIESINTGKPIMSHYKNSEICHKLKDLAGQIYQYLIPDSETLKTDYEESRSPAATETKRNFWGIF